MSSDSKQGGKRTGRFWPRFTLRLVLLAITAVCVGLGVWTHRAREQKKLVQRIVSGGGNVEYDFPLDPRTSEPLESSVPKWLLDRLGVDFFHSVREVGLVDLSVLPELTRLRSLDRLVVKDKRMTDADLAPLAELDSLTSLLICLGDNETPLPPVGDRTLVAIAELHRLESAWIAGSRITPQGIAALARSKSLRRINVACADPQIGAEAATPFRQTGRVSYFCIERFAPGKVEKIVAWNERSLKR